MTGRLIAVVGPSGVGKDSVMAGIKSAMPRAHLVRRVITRAPGLGGEDYDAVTPDQFEALVRDGAFVLHWGAHDLRYGIPTAVRYQLNRSTDCLVNLSRGVLTDAAARFDSLVVLHVTATPETLAERLATRGRESTAEIAKRLARAAGPLPPGLEVITLANDGALADTVARAVAALGHTRADAQMGSMI